MGGTCFFNSKIFLRENGCRGLIHDTLWAHHTVDRVFVRIQDVVGRDRFIASTGWGWGEHVGEELRCRHVTPPTPHPVDAINRSLPDFREIVDRLQ